MADQKLIITPKTKIGELLDSYPELEKLLMEMSPSFSKLKNPILRKTIARVTSLQQAAVVGGIKVDDLVNRLRKETGQTDYSTDIIDTEYLSSTPPLWFDELKINIRYNAIPVINAGKSPMNEILSQAHSLNEGEILEFRTPFVPAPIIDMLKSKDYKVYSLQKGDEILNYITGRGKAAII
jgi:hypothetical protein